MSSHNHIITIIIISSHHHIITSSCIHHHIIIIITCSCIHHHIITITSLCIHHHIIIIMITCSCIHHHIMSSVLSRAHLNPFIRFQTVICRGDWRFGEEIGDSDTSPRRAEILFIYLFTPSITFVHFKIRSELFTPIKTTII